MQVVKVSRAELEQAARDEYQRRFGAAAPPKVRNAEALAALGEPRALRWRGHTYRVPPVPFTQGWRLYVAAQVLSGDHPEREQERALRVGRKVAGALVETRRFRLNPFRTASADEMSALIDWFLSVPDDTPHYIEGHAPRVVDLLDGLHEFVAVFPALVNDRGLPVSWAHYQYGLRYLRRVRAREEIRMAQAARLAQADMGAWRRYSDDLRRAAEAN